MKTIILFLVIFLTQNCNPKATTIEPQEKIPAEIMEVYFQKWVGGQEQTGSGIDFHIQFKIALPKDVELKKVFFQNNEANFEQQEKTTFVAHLKFNPKSDIILDADSKNEYGNKAPEIKNKKPDIQSNEAVLEFFKNGKVIKIKIKNIEEKKIILYPSSRPGNE